MKNKFLLISGCSHAAGSEIDGTQDSEYNRSNSFGNMFAKKIGYTPINAAAVASNNQCIANTVLEWFDRFYLPEEMDVKVLVAWTESTRIDVPMERNTDYGYMNPFSNFMPDSERGFIKVNLGYKGTDTEEIIKIEGCHRFIIDNPIFIELISMSMVLKLQYFFKSNHIDYLMCNTMYMFSDDSHLKFQANLVDKTRYMNFSCSEDSFYWKYKNIGYSNPKAKFWHHNEEPHSLYSEEIYNFYKHRHD